MGTHLFGSPCTMLHKLCSFCVMSCCHNVSFVAKVLYLILGGWLYQAVLLISFNTWPISPTCTALGPGETEGIEYSNSWICWVLRKCSWNGHVKPPLQKWTWGYPQTPIAWHWRFRTSLFHHNSWFLWLLLDAVLKSFCTSHWVGPRKNASNRAPHLLRPALESSTSCPQKQKIEPTASNGDSLVDRAAIVTMQFI